MRRIQYKRHLTALILAITILWSVLAIDLVPVGVDRFVFFFGLMGALHATSLVVSLRDAKRTTPTISFIALAALLSVATPLSAWGPAWLTSHLTELVDARLLLTLALASAFDACAYWLLIRVFWLKSLTLADLWMTGTMCAAATVLSWASLGMLTPTSGRWDVRDVIPTAAWWAAFSFSLFLSEEPVPRTNASARRSFR
jgi:hypothetical protein